MVLGTVKHDDYGNIFRFYVARVQATAALYHAGKIDTVLVSSNNSRRYYYNATTIKIDLLKEGVPLGRILVDTLGLRTYNSVIRCRDAYGVDTVTIITQQWHGERTLFIASNSEVDAILYAADGKYRLAKFEAVYHELAAQFLMFWDLLKDKIK
jgi:SanA protein